MTHDPTHDAEMDAIVAELEKAGLVETTVRSDGQTAYTPTQAFPSAGAIDARPSSVNASRSPTIARSTRSRCIGSPVAAAHLVALKP
jgi:hypothetical protein